MQTDVVLFDRRPDHLSMWKGRIVDSERMGYHNPGAVGGRIETCWEMEDRSGVVEYVLLLCGILSDNAAKTCVPHTPKW